MPVKLEDALAMQPGTMLQFNTSAFYEVLSVEARGADVYIALRRDDGVETFATSGDLNVASIRGVKSQPAQNNDAGDDNTANSDANETGNAEDAPVTKSKGKK